MISLPDVWAELVGLAQTPLRGQASDIFTDLTVLQRLSDRRGRANALCVRADGADAVAGLERSIEGAEITIASERAHRVGGSLVDARGRHLPSQHSGGEQQRVAIAGAAPRWCGCWTGAWPKAS